MATYVVQADADDGYWVSGGVFSNINLRVYRGLGSGVTGDFLRFINISGITVGDVIDSCILRLNGYGTGEGTPTGNPSTIIKFELGAAPAQVTSSNDADSRSLTTASVTCSIDTGNNASGPKQGDSADLKSVAQEVVNSNTPTVFQVFILNNGGSDYAVDNSYQASTTLCAQLIITSHTPSSARLPSPVQVRQAVNRAGFY